MANWFVAFKVDPGEWFKEILLQLPPGLKYFHPDDIHMTIAFLGNFNAELKPGVVEIIKNFAFEPVTVNSTGIIVLPSQRRFSAICADFRFQPDTIHVNTIQINLQNESNAGRPAAQNRPVQNKSMESISRFKDEIYKAANVPVDTRPFLPHVTIARPPRKMSFLQREKLLGQLLKIRPKEFSVTLKTIALYTWADHRIDFKADAGEARKKEPQFKIVYPEH